jgi:hypothetical protein
MRKYLVRITPSAIEDYEVIAFGAFHTSGQLSKYAKELVERLKELQ